MRYEIFKAEKGMEVLVAEADSLEEALRLLEANSADEIIDTQTNTIVMG